MCGRRNQPTRGGSEAAAGPAGCTRPAQHGGVGGVGGTDAGRGICTNSDTGVSVGVGVGVVVGVVVGVGVGVGVEVEVEVEGRMVKASSAVQMLLTATAAPGAPCSTERMREVSARSALGQRTAGTRSALARNRCSWRRTPRAICHAGVCAMCQAACSRPPSPPRTPARDQHGWPRTALPPRVRTRHGASSMCSPPF